MKRLNLIGILCWFCCCCQAQQYKAPLRYSGNKGLYLVQIPVGIRGLIGDSLQWLRFRDAQGVDAPFMYWEPARVHGGTPFIKVPYTLVHHKRSTMIIMRNNKAESAHYVLQIANSEADKSYIVEGSDDQRKWFSIVNQGFLGNNTSDTGTFTYKEISFPPSGYRFIRILFRDQQAAPLKILSVGEWASDHPGRRWEQVTACRYIVKERPDLKETIIPVSKSGLFPIGKISFWITAPEYYSRNISVSGAHDTDNVLASAVLSPDNKDILLPVITPDSSFLLKVENEDSPPLQIEKIEFFERPLSVLVQLEEGKSYQLMIDRNFAVPHYDMERINLPDVRFPEAVIGDYITLGQDKHAPLLHPSEKSYGKYILWAAVGIGSVIAFLFAFKLLKELKA